MLPQSLLAVLTDRRLLSFRWLLLSLLALVTCLPLAGPAGAQSTVDWAEPPLEGTVAVAPDQIGIWFTEPLQDEADAIAITVIGSSGAVQPTGTPTIYSVDPRHASVPLTGELPAGTYSVLWTARFAGETAERSGAYAFRVGPAGVPGAATEPDAFPALWAIVARVLTLFGLALVLGGLIAGGFAATLHESPATDRGRRLVMLTGAGLALLGTVAEPVFAAVLTVPTPDLPAVLAGQPSAWTVRAAVLIALLVLSVAMVLGAFSTTARRAIWLTAVLLGAIALVATCLSGIVQGTPPNGAADATVVLLQAVIVLLTGVAVHLALFAPAPERAAPSPATRALLEGPWPTVALAAIALAGTIALGALLLPGALAWIEQLFGQVLILIGLSLAAMLLLGILFRHGRPAAGRWGLAALAAISLVGAAVLALLTPPSGAAMPASLAAVSLVDSVPLTLDGEPGLVHLQYQPATTGENAFIVWLATPGGVTPPATAQPELAIELRSLSHEAPPVSASAAASDTGRFTVATANLTNTGWWQASVSVTPETGETTTAEFFLLVPDPNVAGFGPQPPSAPAAEAVFERGLAAMTSLRQVRFRIGLGSGAGTFASSEITIDDGSDDSTRAYHERAAGYETIIVGDRQWIRFAGEDWSEREAGFINTPANWGDIYERATGFALGPIVEVGGEPAQVVTFWLPRQEEPRQEPAWFAWWVGTETGQVHRETMISNRHYMVYDFAEFNQPVEITPPADL